MKIYNFITNLNQITGVQKVMLDIHDALKENYDISFVSYLNYSDISPNLDIDIKDYVQIDNLFQLKNAVVVVHERRIAFLLGLLKKIRNLKVIYVHHSEMSNYPFVPILADKFVSISDSGINNLTKVLHVNKSKIIKIHNCVKDTNPNALIPVYKGHGIIKIALVGTIYNVKRQVEIVRNLKDRIPSYIHIDFIGSGPQYSELLEEIGESLNFKALGFKPNVTKLLHNYNYGMLFSHHEGLPISLIEASMMGLPLISNNIGGCPEIVHNNYNGFVVDTFDELNDLLRRLNLISKDDYINLANNSRKLYESLYSFELFQDKYNELISLTIN